MSTTTDYFLGDALGSVRQLADAQGEISLAKSYQPYGETLSSAGNGSSPFAFTGEQQDSSGLTYLRARYYSSGDGRFLTRDTWMGDYNNPLSLNRWNYTSANPVNYTDPSGNYRTPPFDGCGLLGLVSLDWAARYADEYVNLSKSDWLNTYTAAGIAVQCWAGSVQDIFVSDPDHSGLGPGQITNMQASTPYGEWIEDLGHPGDKNHSRGYGLRCYIFVDYVRLPKEVQMELVKSCSLCFLPDQVSNISNFNNYYALEPVYNQNDIDGATIHMKRRIKLVIDVCQAKGCHDTDKFIAAALAQDSPLFTQYHMRHLDKLSGAQQNEKAAMKWEPDFINQPILSEQLYRFKQATLGLISRGWSVPDIDMTYVDYLINRNFTSTVPQ